jgi:LysM repeat protein
MIASTSPMGRLLARGIQLLAGCSVLFAMDLQGQSLRGGAASLDRQNAQAAAHNFTYLATPADVMQFVELGHLVPVVTSATLQLHNVSFPFARPEVRLFLERLSEQYRAACGEALVVTSLTRPQSNQPWNASSRSVHPTGMAVDLRRSNRASCRQWLEQTLLGLEARGLIEAIYERNPPHYHVAVYPQPYVQYVARLTGETVNLDHYRQSSFQVEWVTHQVRRGETLSTIARQHQVSVSRIRAENQLRGDHITVGQSLRIPSAREVVATSAVMQAGGNAVARGGATETVRHTVRSGESLWGIAQRHGTTVEALSRANGLRGATIRPGQVLDVPVGP